MGEVSLLVLLRTPDILGPALCGGRRHVMQEAKERVSVALADDQAGGGKAAATTQMERAIRRLSHDGTLQE
jgi:hypothetical protein